MRRLLILLVGLLLALCAPALAQDPDDPVDDEDVIEQVEDQDEEDIGDDEDIVDDGEELPPESDYYCIPGDEGDYQYCGCGIGYGDDGDYLYCPSAGEGGPPRRRDEEAGSGLPAATQTLPASSLPLTGSEPGLAALIGLGFLLIGLGGRLMAGGRRPSG